MTAIKLAQDLSIPTEALTQTFAILAKRGAGKTYTALVLAEEMFQIGQIVVVDPVGVCWGLRAAANGTDSGLPITVVGGEHGDVGLEPASGEAIADFVVEERQSVVLDLSDFSGNQMAQFVTDFAETLYRRNREPLHLFLDEADAFAPQKPMPGEQRMLGAIDRLVRRGRAKGIGVTAITQRPAVLNKNVLTQIEVLIALRTVSPQDRKAIESWIEVHGTEQERNTLMASLPSLPVGTAWIWSPGWLNLFQQVQIRPRFTFDSSATPKVGTMPASPGKLAVVDLSKLQRRIGATVNDQAKLSDREQVRHLQSRITELEQQLQETQERVEVPIFQDGEVQRLEAALESLLNFGERLLSTAESIANTLKATNTKLIQEESSLLPHQFKAEAGDELTLPQKSSELTKPQQRILDALAEFEALGLTAIAKHNLAVFADQSPTSGGYTNNLGRLRSLGLIDYPSSGKVQLTESGRQKARTPARAKSVEALHDAWYAKLSNPQSNILRVLVQIYPEAIDKQVLAGRVQQSPTSGGYTNNLGKLRSLGVIDYPKPGQVVATDLLFPLLPKLQSSSRNTGL